MTRARAAASRRVIPALLGALVLLLAFELTGAVATIFLALHVERETACCSDCPEEEGGRECPPACPSCHCAHASPALPPTDTGWIADAFDVIARVEDAPRTSTAPTAPPRSSVYRPPRHAAFSA